MKDGPIRATLEIRTDELRRWRKVMNSTSPRDFEEFGYRGTVVFCMSAPFGDGVEADLRVVTSISEGENPWCEVIFFKRYGRQMIESAVTDVSDDMEGDWRATIDGKDYVLSVVKQDSAQRTGYAAVWHDDSTDTYGMTERVFMSRARCLTFAADMIVRKAKECEVSILDLDATPSIWKGEKVYPVLNKAQVRDILGGGNEFALVTKFDELERPIEKFKVNIMEVEVE